MSPAETNRSPPGSLTSGLQLEPTVAALIRWLGLEGVSAAAESQVFVTGSSAGAYGAVTHSVGLLELFPEAQVDVVGDGGNGVVTQNFLLNYLSTWGFEKHLPEEVPELNEREDAPF